MHIGNAYQKIVGLKRDCMYRDQFYLSIVIGGIVNVTWHLHYTYLEQFSWQYDSDPAPAYIHIEPPPVP